ncbi:hypothetical protein VNO77_16132 [Canavalia gladiata]|uniref:Uncharacterized protein n=1 Tax=Canavalia gladiata TaxID=3824 RepID=A0AAN9QWB8_CANGL
MLRFFFGKIHCSLSVLLASRRTRGLGNNLNEDPLETAMEGHFVVLAKNGEETKRFVVELHYLSEPAFLGLLERAKEEYGFNQKGVLVIPCHPQELEKILEEPRDDSVRVADDVREGYFVVLAMKNQETKRFLVELDCLNYDSAFLEEYGFKQQGAAEHSRWLLSAPKIQEGINTLVYSFLIYE